jgi:hypothetical protein
MGKYVNKMYMKGQYGETALDGQGYSMDTMKSFYELSFPDFTENRRLR